jgi:hypothetical protein
VRAERRARTLSRWFLLRPGRSRSGFHGFSIRRSAISNQQSAFSNQQLASLTPLSVPPTIGLVQTQATPTEAARTGRASTCLFLAVLCVYLLFARGRITSGDEWHVYGTTESLVERGSWQVQVAGFDRKYSRYSVIPSLLGVPFYMIGRPIADARRPGQPTDGMQSSRPAPSVKRGDILQAAVSLQTPLVTAATAAVLLCGLMRLGVGGGPALATACVFAFGTMALPYSCSMFTQPLAALGMACVVMTVANGFRQWAGVSLFFLLAVRLEFIVLVPVLILFEWRFCGGQGLQKVHFIGSAAAGLCFTLMVNWLRGDHLFLSDYGSEGFTTPIWIGLQGVLVSPGKGLLWFSPVATIGLALLPWLWRNVPRVGFLAMGVSATCLILVACWWTWHGARSWGPRLLLPIMPVLVLPLAWLFRDWTQVSAARRWLLVAAIGASVAVQFWGTLRSPVSEGVLIMPSVAANENESIYIPQTGPWGVESQDFPDLLLWRLWVNESQWHGALIVIAGLLVGVAAVAAWGSCRACCLPVGCSRAAMPPVRLREFAAIAGGVAIVVLPELLIAVLIAGGPRAEQTQHRSGSRQFRRLTTGPSGGNSHGTLYVPISGDYTFYEQSPVPMRCFMDDAPIFRPGAEHQTPGFVSLKAGPHRIRIEHGGTAGVATLYWTTPGLANYKTRIPELYLTGPTVTWRDRLAINLAHSKWVAWVTALVLLLAVFTGPNRPGVCDIPGNQTIAPGKNG